jgi:hypothetical protein
MGQRLSQADEEKIQKLQVLLETEKQAREQDKEREQRQKKELESYARTIDKLHHIEEFKKLKDKIDSLVNNYNNRNYAKPEHLCDIVGFLGMVDSGRFNWLKNADRAALAVIGDKWGDMQYIFDEKPDNSHRAFMRQAIQQAADRLADVSLYRFPYY